MVRITEQAGKCWKSELQRLLEQESIATAELVSREDCLQVTQRDLDRARAGGLTFGPYEHSPIKGLHFDSPEDTAAS
jgi:hypothetical protein